MDKQVLTRQEAEQVLAAYAIIRAATNKIKGDQITVFDATLQEHCRVVIEMAKEAVS